LLAAGRLIRPYFYCSIGVPPDPQQLKFRDSLGFRGFTVITKPLKLRPHGAVEKGVDVSIVIDMLKFAFLNIFDVCILVSGDEDFVEAVKIIKERGMNVEIVSFKHNISRDLRMLADRFTYIDDILDKVQII